MRGAARPITADQRRTRLEHARRLMAGQKIDALLLMGGTSLMYFSNIRWGTWEEHESPYQRIAQGLRDRGVSSGRIGIEETVRFVFGDGIAAAAPALRIVSGTPVTAGCRGVKDAHELELMRLASKVTRRAYEAAYGALRAGMTQDDFGDLVSAAHEKLGFAGEASVQVGEYSALPHGSITPQTIREGTILLIDGGCSVDGYQSDLSRTFVLGKATEKMTRVFDIERRAQDAALETPF